MANALKEGLVGYYPLQSNAVNMVDGVAGTINGTASWVKNHAGKVVLDDTTASITHASHDINTITYWKDGSFYAVLNGVPYMVDEALSSSFGPAVTSQLIGCIYANDFLDASSLNNFTITNYGGGSVSHLADIGDGRPGIQKIGRNTVSLTSFTLPVIPAGGEMWQSADYKVVTPAAGPDVFSYFLSAVFHTKFTTPANGNILYDIRPFFTTTGRLLNLSIDMSSTKRLVFKVKRSSAAGVSDGNYQIYVGNTLIATSASVANFNSCSIPLDVRPFAGAPTFSDNGTMVMTRLRVGWTLESVL